MSPRRLRRASLVAATVALLIPSGALAHASLVRSVPADGSVLAVAPRSVRLVFDDAVQVGGGNEVVANAGGRSALGGKPRVDSGSVLVLPLRPKLAGGDYSVRWRVLSDDGHFVSGVLAFAIGAGRASPQSVLRAAAGSPSPRDVVARWLLFAGLLAAAGAAVFAALVFRPALRGLAEAQRSRVERVEQLAFGALVGGGCALFAAAAATLEHGGWDTRFGAALTVGAIAGLVGATCAGLSFVDRGFRAPAAAAGLGIAAVPSVAGHALDPGVPAANVAVDLVHVAAAAAWLGVLAGLLILLPAARRAGGGVGRSLARRGSAVALVSVAVLGATGIVRAVFELRALEQLWTTGYGRALLAKTALLLGLVALGRLNRSRLLPVSDVRRLRRNVSLELVLFAGVIVAVAFLTQLRPGRAAPLARAAVPASPAQSGPPPPPPRGALVLAREAGRRALAIAVQPRRVTATVLAPSGGGEDGLDVEIDGTPAAPCGHGCYAAAVRADRRVAVGLAGNSFVFALPRSPRPAGALVARATRAFKRLDSVAYREALASSPSDRIVTSWRLEAPDRLAYAIDGGPAAVVIGGTRWDRTGPQGRWVRSQSSPLEIPQPTWGARILDARVLREDGSGIVVAWANTEIPAWFTVRFARRTLRPLDLKMTAAAHFMHQRYVSFNRPLGIRPPR